MATTTHEQKVARIAARLKARTAKTPVSLKKKAVSHEVPKPGDKRHADEKIDVSGLDRILHINPERRLCVAEPGVTFVELVKATLAHGLVPIVVPELKTITVGGNRGGMLHRVDVVQGRRLPRFLPGVRGHHRQGGRPDMHA